MSSRSQSPHRITPLHALAAIALAVLAWHFFDRAADVHNAGFTSVPSHDARCMYQVVMGDECLGAVFSPEPKQAYALLAAAGVRRGEMAGLRDTVPCGSTIRIDAGAQRIEVVKLSGALLLAAGLRIDVNRASAEDLEAVPGIGPKLAAKIVSARDTRGPFTRVDDLRIVPGIGRKKLAEFAPFLEANPVTLHPQAATRPVRIASP